MSTTHVSCHVCKIYPKDKASLLEHYKSCTLVPCPICARLTPRDNFEDHYRKHPRCEFCQQVRTCRRALRRPYIIYGYFHDMTEVAGSNCVLRCCGTNKRPKLADRVRAGNETSSTTLLYISFFTTRSSVLTRCWPIIYQMYMPPALNANNTSRMRRSETNTQKPAGRWNIL